MSYSELFEINPGLVHLNHAGISPWPRATVKAVTQFAYENASWSSRRYDMWLQEEWELRELGRWLLDAESKDEIAFLKNTSEGISAVAFGLDWEAGDNVVLAREEFPSNRIPWEAVATQHSVEIRWVDVNTTDTPEQALLGQVDSRTRLLTTSSVHYASGLKMDLSLLGHALHGTPTLFCVDAIQSLGAHSLRRARKPDRLLGGRCPQVDVGAGRYRTVLGASRTVRAARPVPVWLAYGCSSRPLRGNRLGHCP